MKDLRCHFVEMFILIDNFLVDVQGRKFYLSRKFRQNDGTTHENMVNFDKLYFFAWPFESRTKNFYLLSGKT